MTPADVDCVSMCVLAIAIYVPQMIGALRGFVEHSRPQSSRVPVQPRASVGDALYAVSPEIMMICLVVLTWSRGWWTWRQIAMSNTSPLIGAVAGAGTFGLLLVLWRLFRVRAERLGAKVASRLRLRLPSDEAQAAKVPRSRSYAAEMHAYWPRTRTGRTLVALRLGLSPAIEEFATRGILVGMVYFTTNSIVIGLFSGGLICVILHSHTRWRGMLYHLGFFFVTVMTALVFGLMGAIVLHVLTDLAHAFTFHIGHIKSLRSWERGHRG